MAAAPVTAAASVTAAGISDRALCAVPGLVALPGRFLFAIDDGAGDVAYSADVAALRLPSDEAGAAERFAVLFAGRDVGLRVGRELVVPALLAAAHAFLTRAEEAVAAGQRRPWRVRELGDGPALLGADTVGALAGTGLITYGEVDPSLRRPGVREPIGPVEQAGGRVAAAALVPLGRLGQEQLRVLERAEVLVVTPWRGVVVPDLTADEAAQWLRELAGAGLEVGAGSRWAGVTACAGRPGCHRALADVRRDADTATVAAEGLPVHWVGCARGCGSPQGPHVRVEATGSGYRVGSGPDDVKSWDEESAAGELAGLVAGARKG